MRQKTLARISAAGASLALVLGLIVPFAQAATGNMYINLSAASVQQGNTFTATIRINPGTAVDTVDVTLSYDPAKVQYQSITYGGSPLTTQLGFSSTASSLHFMSGLLGGSVSSDTFIATATFKALGGSGNSTLSLAGSNAAYSGTLTNPALGSSTVSFATPPSTCPAGQIGTPPNCTTPVSPKPTPTPTPTPSPTPTKPAPRPIETAPKPSPASADINPTLTATQVQYTLAKLKITTKSPAEVYVRYGMDRENLISSSPVSSLGTNHEISFEAMGPGSTVYYTIFSKDDKGQTVQGEVQSFTLKGFDVKVTVLDRNHKPLKNAEVTLHSTPQTAKTDANGMVTFSNVAAGEHELIYKGGKKTYNERVVVANDVKTVGETQSAELQNFSVVYNLAQNSNGWLMTLTYVLLLAVVVFVGYRLISSRRAPQYAYDTTLASKITVGNASSPATSQTNDTLTTKLNNMPTPNAITPGTVVKSTDENDSSNDREA